MIKTRITKRGLSEIVSYVLLIFIAFTVATVVFIWLRGPGDNRKIEPCPDGVSITIQNAACDAATNRLSLTIRNSGKFNVSGFIVQGSLPSKAGAWSKLPENDASLVEVGEFNIIVDAALIDHPLAPGAEGTYQFSYDNAPFSGTLENAMIGIVRNQTEHLIICENSYLSQPVSCT